MKTVSNLLLCVAALLCPTFAAWANGQLDPRFGNGGRSLGVFATDASLPGAYTAPVKTLVQSDERVLMIVNTPTPMDSQFPGNTQIGVMRFGAGGFPDFSYGFESKVLLDAGVDFEVNAVDALLLDDQSVIVLGTIFGPFDESDMALWKLRPSGQRDTSFGSNGFKRIRRGGSPQDVAGALTRLPGSASQLLVVGAIRDASNQARHVAQMVVDGSTGAICTDPACGPVVGGDVGLPTEWRLLRMAVSHNGGPVDVEIEDVEALVSPNGVGLRFRILLNRSNANGAGEFDSLLIGTRIINSNGMELDTDVGSNGLLSFFFSAAPGYRHNHATAMTLQYRAVPSMPPVQTLVLVGFVTDAGGGDPSIGVLRVDANGGSDPSFNGNGSALVFDYATPSLHGDAYATDVLIDYASSKILIGGVFEYLGFAAGDAAVVRLNDNGSFDSSFGGLSASLPGRAGYGHEILGSDRDNRLQSMALSADGEHVVFSGMGQASSSGYQYGSVMKLRLFPTELLRDGFE